MLSLWESRKRPRVQIEDEDTEFQLVESRPKPSSSGIEFANFLLSQAANAIPNYQGEEEILEGEEEVEESAKAEKFVEDILKESSPKMSGASSSSSASGKMEEEKEKSSQEVLGLIINQTGKRYTAYREAKEKGVEQEYISNELQEKNHGSFYNILALPPPIRKYLLFLLGKLWLKTLLNTPGLYYLYGPKVKLIEYQKIQKSMSTLNKFNMAASSSRVSASGGGSNCSFGVSQKPQFKGQSGGGKAGTMKKAYNYMYWLSN